jgi:hypothetical protein
MSVEIPGEFISGSLLKYRCLSASLQALDIFAPIQTDISIIPVGQFSSSISSQIFGVSGRGLPFAVCMGNPDSVHIRFSIFSAIRSTDGEAIWTFRPVYTPNFEIVGIMVAVLAPRAGIGLMILRDSLAKTKLRAFRNIDRLLDGPLKIHIFEPFRTDRQSRKSIRLN